MRNRRLHRRRPSHLPIVVQPWYLPLLHSNLQREQDVKGGSGPLSKEHALCHPDATNQLNLRTSWTKTSALILIAKLSIHMAIFIAQNICHHQSNKLICEGFHFSWEQGGAQHLSSSSRFNSDDADDNMCRKYVL